jgi:hypothetical protein
LAQFLQLAAIGPHLFCGFLSERDFNVLLDLVDLVFGVFLRPHPFDLDLLFDLVSDLTEELIRLKFDYDFKIGGPTVHALPHLLWGMSSYHSASAFGVQRFEARIGLARRDLRIVSKQRSRLTMGLMSAEAGRLGMRYALHGGRWNRDLVADPTGEHQAGIAWRLRADPHNPHLSHPILRALSAYFPMRGASPSPWLFGATGIHLGHGTTKAQPVELSQQQLSHLRSVYEKDFQLMLDEEGFAPTAGVLKSSTIGDQTYASDDNVLARFVDADSQEYDWPVRITQLLSHSPMEGKQAVWFRFRRFEEVLVRGESYMGAVRRKILRLAARSDDLLLSSSVIQSPVALFHYCRLASDELKSLPAISNLADIRERKQASAGRVIHRFNSKAAVEATGPPCGMATVIECRLHSKRECSDALCSSDASRHSVQRFCHDFGRNLFALERNWTGR